ncbi:putative ABC transporter anion-binding protein [Candidatus Desulfarcum epimagneticum]|uniref:Putative ABC transporter anion-binding protein n=1 Tax=uncultured Desulfobacteraceae bacterium TaxID=218296 RepID=A0A484HDY6_9BACT|nr:putative ABC transporter anion-binding protein [uncultured Desulfobacteraceae bacterium]
MRRIAFGTLWIFMAAALPGAAFANDTLKMSTTTSAQASGLLDQLLPVFEKETGIKVKVIAKGTGAAIRDGMDGNVDVIFVHDRAREDRFVREGHGVKRYAVMHNDFVILGPGKDPAGVSGMKDAAAALKKIAAAQSRFVSRGDDSGTHGKERRLWKKTGLALEKIESVIVKKGKKKKISFVRPAASEKWYVSIGQGMGAALTFADEKRAYVLSDRGAYIKYRHGRKIPIDLEVLCEGDAALDNPYGVIPVSPKRHPHVNARAARIFAEWLVSRKGQAIIRDYTLLGKTLFYPDAIR